MKPRISSVRPRSAVLLIFIVLPLGIADPREVHISRAEIAAGITPVSCITTERGTPLLQAADTLCRSHHAYFGVDDPAGLPGPGEAMVVSAACCPLPSRTTLRDDHTFEPRECRDDRIATGSTRVGERVLFRCTRINSDRFQLGPITRGVYWGDGFSGGQGAARTRWELIPEALRASQGRLSVDGWDIDGCIGYPWGSLLVRKQTKYCRDFGFRQLQYRGVNGDPSAGTPVVIFANH